jgi:hypothetical protein
VLYVTWRDQASERAGRSLAEPEARAARVIRLYDYEEACKFISSLLPFEHAIGSLQLATALELLL